MKIILIQVGSTVDKYLNIGVNEYSNRLKHYTRFETIEIKDIKNAGRLSRDELKKKEASEISSRLNNSDYVVLLDERGKEFTSEKFATFIQDRMNSGVKRVVFIIGGAFGFSEEIYQRANNKISLSQMTFSHRMIRLLFTEQLYRAHTILRGEPYHH
ncbi:MAG: 23S rRNA (pseudouridine(1915)-N(3))-methyltransferase RlmH [Lentisphaeraceae bacterium]|nr:23S rRNA (pseudouridine(1915)-N(3))-methyltransferase RlmH [Lentisphaeraceae bacterium]